MHALTTINHEWKDTASVVGKMACCRTYVWLHACTSLPGHVGKGIFMSFLFFFFCNNLPKKQELETSFKEFCFVSSINPIGGCGLRSSWQSQQYISSLLVLRYFCSTLYCNLSKNTNKKNSIWQCDDAITDNHIVDGSLCPPSTDRAAAFALILLPSDFSCFFSSFELYFSKRHPGRAARRAANCQLFLFSSCIWRMRQFLRSRLAPNMLLFLEEI